MAEPIQWREPERFAIGDTLKFQRNFPNYQPINGWSMEYTLTPPVTVAAEPADKQALNFASQPDSTNTYHTFDVLNFGAGLTEGLYILEGVLICSPTGESPNERHQVYYGNLQLVADLTDGLATQPLTTHAQRMIVILEAQIETLAAQLVTATDVQRTRIEFVDIPKIRMELKEYQEKRMNEIKIENVRNGRNAHDQLAPMFRIV